MDQEKLGILSGGERDIVPVAAAFGDFGMPGRPRTRGTRAFARGALLWLRSFPCHKDSFRSFGLKKC
jgi:hypothetical protein